MLKKWKDKLKAAYKEAKGKRHAKEGKHSHAETLAQPVVATDKHTDALSRPRECLLH